MTIVGDAAAFSPDGAWFAFTARPADGSSGPRYLRLAGRRCAGEGGHDRSRSEFGSWSDGLVVGSRADVHRHGRRGVRRAGCDSQSGRELDRRTVAATPVLFAIDPATGAETILAAKAWRPAVDPTGALAVAWDGTVVAVGRRHVDQLGRGSSGARAPWEDGSNDIDPAAYTVTDGPLGDFAVRWDETGTWLAVWVASVSDPAVGRLSLLHVDPATGAVDRPEAGPQDVPALPGFSIENGRLAWATPPSQDGEGSRVQIVAWSADGVGSIESAPGQDVVVVR